VVQGCKLYKSTEGWSEADPEQIANALVLLAKVGPTVGPSSQLRDYWSWSVRGPAIVESVLQLQPA
jgi:hypothetical protein